MHRLRWRLVFWSLLLEGLLGLSPRASLAQSYCPSGTQGWRAVAYQEWIVDATTVRQIDVSALPPSATNLAMALVSVESATLRFRFQGVPTSDSGHELEPGGKFFLCGRSMIEDFRAIRTSQGAINALVRISLFQPY